MNGSLTLQPYTEVVKDRNSGSGNFVTFTGVQLQEAKLKDWLRSCAPQVGCYLNVLFIKMKDEIPSEFFYLTLVILPCSLFVSV